VIAEHLSVEEVAGIKEGFQVMDTSNKGKIDMEELRVGLHKLGHQIPEADLQILMEAVSLTRSFKISLLCVGLIWDLDFL
jgi:calcium-dependent protein kinase